MKLGSLTATAYIDFSEEPRHTSVSGVKGLYEAHVDGDFIYVVRVAPPVANRPNVLRFHASNLHEVEFE